MSGSGTLARIMNDLAASGIGPLDEARRELLGTFIREVALWSGRIHLVGKRHIRKTVSDLVVDSWILCRFAGERGILEPAGNRDVTHAPVRVADVGSGAGFPGIVWKIAAPELDIALFERREKTLRFLERVVTLMRVDGLHTEGSGADGADFSGRFDVVVSKAAGQLQLLAPLAARLLRAGGTYITMKGSGWKQETEEAGTAPLQLAIAEELPTGRGTMLSFVRENSSN